MATKRKNPFATVSSEAYAEAHREATETMDALTKYRQAVRREMRKEKTPAGKALAVMEMFHALWDEHLEGNAVATHVVRHLALFQLSEDVQMPDLSSIRLGGAH